MIYGLELHTHSELRSHEVLQRFEGSRLGKGLDPRLIRAEPVRGGVKGRSQR
jgi:hypothetical protein